MNMPPFTQSHFYLKSC